MRKEVKEKHKQELVEKLTIIALADKRRVTEKETWCLKIPDSSGRLVRLKWASEHFFPIDFSDCHTDDLKEIWQWIRKFNFEIVSVFPEYRVLVGFLQMTNSTPQNRYFLLFAAKHMK